jgi:hypothetical protein
VRFHERWPADQVPVKNSHFENALAHVSCPGRPIDQYRSLAETKVGDAMPDVLSRMAKFDPAARSCDE